MIVDISKESAKTAAKFWYNHHVDELKKLPENYATATPFHRTLIEHHEKAALTYLWAIRDLR